MKDFPNAKENKTTSNTPDVGPVPTPIQEVEISTESQNDKKMAATQAERCKIKLNFYYCQIDLLKDSFSFT